MQEWNLILIIIDFEFWLVVLMSIYSNSKKISNWDQTPVILSLATALMIADPHSKLRTNNCVLWGLDLLFKRTKPLRRPLLNMNLQSCETFCLQKTCFYHSFQCWSLDDRSNKHAYFFIISNISLLLATIENLLY